MYNCLLQKKYYKLHNKEYISISYETYTYCHKECVERLIKLPSETQDIAEQFSSKFSLEKKANRQALLKILKNLRFLARQGLAVRGDGSFE